MAPLRWIDRGEQYEGDEAADEQPLRNQVNPVGRRATGRQRLDCSEEGQQVRAPDSDESAGNPWWVPRR